jgi:hypothetical protein
LEFACRLIWYLEEVENGNVIIVIIRMMSMMNFRPHKKERYCGHQQEFIGKQEREGNRQ